MAELSLSVQRRDSTGKNAARSLRSEGMIPGVVYGGGVESVKISVARRDMRLARPNAKGRSDRLILSALFVREICAGKRGFAAEGMDKFFFRTTSLDKVRLSALFVRTGFPLGDAIQERVKLACRHPLVHGEVRLITSAFLGPLPAGSKPRQSLE